MHACTCSLLPLDDPRCLEYAGPVDYYLKQGERIQVNFKAKPTLVIVGGSQNLQFLNDPVFLKLAMLLPTLPGSNEPSSCWGRLTSKVVA